MSFKLAKSRSNVSLKGKYPKEVFYFIAGTEKKNPNKANKNTGIPQLTDVHLG